ncbi:MAG: NERD domain-containing protein [Devosia sp.]|nr:NERD domain-containing protein [Devosia sp.]
MKTALNHTKIFIGDTVANGSVQAVLACVVAHLETAHISCVIFANVNLGGRQLDCIVLTETRALVIEAKGYRRRLRGGPNGPWQVQIAGGEWKGTRNAYLQARDAALALRDAMRAFATDEPPYPTAALVFEPHVPEGSELSGDFKVAILNLDELPTELEKAGPGGWPLARWLAFAQHHRLIAVTDVAAACDPALAKAEELLTSYRKGFVRTYGPLTVDILSSSWKADTGSMDSEEVTRRITLGADACLLGPSGCGKSATAYCAAIAFAQRDGIPIAIAAKNFSGSMKVMLDDEVQQIVDAQARDVIASAQSLNRPLLLAIDGFNECSENQRVDLLRRAAAFGRRYEALIVITSQTSLSRADLLRLDVYTVAPPSSNLKTAIATQAAAGQPLSASAAELLTVVDSCLEARLVGQLGASKAGHASRFDLFDMFVRSRLGELSALGISRLAAIAGWMTERITFSMSIRDLDRTATGGSPPTITASLVTNRLLSIRGDRVSFSHDLFLDAYSAEAVIRVAANDATAVVLALADPIHERRREFILGAINDPVLLERVLAELADAELIDACLAGRCGRRAREWAEVVAERVFEILAEEIASARLTLSGAGMWSVGFEHSTIAWTKQQRAFVHALPARVAAGSYLDKIIELAGHMDRRLVTERSRLRDEASEKKIALRSEAFGAAYVSQHGEAPGLTHISSRLHAGLVPWHREEALGSMLLERLRRTDLSLGQVYFLLALFRRNGVFDSAAATVIGELLDRYWTGAPYHFKLDLMDSAGWCGRADDAERQTLIDRIEALPNEPHIFLSTTVVEALQHLGALEDSADEYKDVVLREVADCLAAPQDPDACARAYSVYSACMDHPYSNAYCAIFNDLAPSERATMLSMAARGVSDSAAFVAPLIVEIAALPNRQVTLVLDRFLTPPGPDSFNLSEAIEVFALAHLAFGQNQLPLHVTEPAEATANTATLGACGRILYWMNRTDLSLAERTTNSASAQAFLEADRAGLTVNCLRLVERIRIEGWTQSAGLPPPVQSIASLVPMAAIALAKRALNNPDLLNGYFKFYNDHDRLNDLIYAVGIVGRLGTTADIAFLRDYVGDVSLGRPAIEAIREIEERSVDGSYERSASPSWG